MKIVTNVARVIIALVFIISGLLKANDPTGFGFKLHEYFEAIEGSLRNHSIHIALTVLNPAAFALASIISVLEILVGFALLIGLKPKLTVWVTFIMTVFFWLLVGYSAKTDKVTDCGCFGDAIKFTVKEEFRNDTIFLVLIILILFGLKHVKPILNGGIGLVSFIVVFFLSMGFTIKNFLYLPTKDFLPFKIGESIQKNMTTDDPDVYETRLIYTYLPTGADSTFNTARLNAIYREGTDSLYKWKKTENALVHEGKKAPIHDFIIKDQDGTDFTASFFNDDYKLVLTSYDLKNSNKPAFKKIATLSNEWRKTGKDFWGLTNSVSAETEAVKHDYQMFVDFYTLDATPIKMMVRSNPGLLLIKKDVVIKKWSSYNIPSIDEIDKLMK